MKSGYWLQNQITNSQLKFEASVMPSLNHLKSEGDESGFKVSLFPQPLTEVFSRNCSNVSSDTLAYLDRKKCSSF